MPPPSIEKRKKIYLKNIFPEIENESISKSIETTVKLWNKNQNLLRDDPYNEKEPVKILNMHMPPLDLETKNKLENL